MYRWVCDTIILIVPVRTCIAVSGNPLRWAAVLCSHSRVPHHNKGDPSNLLTHFEQCGQSSGARGRNWPGRRCRLRQSCHYLSKRLPWRVSGYIIMLNDRKIVISKGVGLSSIKLCGIFGLRKRVFYALIAVFSLPAVYPNYPPLPRALPAQHGLCSYRRILFSGDFRNGKNH